MKKLFSVRTLILAGSLLLQLNTLCFHSRGAAGDVDLSFDPGFGVNGTVNAVLLQPDGKVIIGGKFTIVKGLARSKVARLNADGSGDATFNPSIVYDVVSSLALQSDGRLLVGSGGISRLNSDGSQDTNFNASIALTNYPATAVASIAVQPDGKVLIGGAFDTVNGTNRNGIARLNANGSLDGGFNPGTGVNGRVSSVALQSDGKVLIGGGFLTVNGTNQYGIARLNADGSLDSSFNPNPSLGGYIYGVNSIVVQSDGKVLIGGDFQGVNGTNYGGIARLNANGSLDGSFNPGTGVFGYPFGVWSIVVQSDGKLLIGGNFYSVNGTNRNNVARLNANGSLDSTFNPGTDTRDYYVYGVSSVVVQADGKVLIGGPFTFINGTNRYGSARLNVDGSLDSTFISDSFHPDLTDFYGTAYEVAAVAVQSDGKVLVGGLALLACADGEEGCQPLFSSFVTRLNPNGSRDTSFTPFVGPSELAPEQTAQVQAVALQPDGKVVVGYVGYGPVRGIVRLNANGIRDTNFNTSLAYPGVYSVVPQADGKMLIGGSFTIVNGTNRNGLARLNSNGSLDNTFNPAVGGYPIALQPDGKVLVGGYARLNADGSLDSSFNQGGASGAVRSIALQADGKVLVGGDFTTIKGVLRPYVARLYGDSSTPPSLNIARSNAFVIVSWPLSATGFVLDQSLAVTGIWSQVSFPYVTNATGINVSTPAPTGNKFYRLRKL